MILVAQGSILTAEPPTDIDISKLPGLIRGRLSQESHPILPENPTALINALRAVRPVNNIARLEVQERKMAVRTHDPKTNRRAWRDDIAIAPIRDLPIGNPADGVLTVVPIEDLINILMNEPGTQISLSEKAVLIVGPSSRGAIACRLKTEHLY